MGLCDTAVYCDSRYNLPITRWKSLILKLVKASNTIIEPPLCDTGGCTSLTNSLPHIDPPIWPKGFDTFVSPKDFIPHLYCPIFECFGPLEPFDIVFVKVQYLRVVHMLNYAWKWIVTWASGREDYTHIDGLVQVVSSIPSVLIGCESRSGYASINICWPTHWHLFISRRQPNQ